MTTDTVTALGRLDVLIGRWKTDGWTRETAGSDAARIDAVDTYERVPGGALLHLVDARVGDMKVDGAELIFYDPTRQRYASQYFGSEGPTAYAASLEDDGGALRWSMWSETTRFSGTFGDGGDTIDGHWELEHEGRWQPWMDITLSKMDS